MKIYEISLFNFVVKVVVAVNHLVVSEMSLQHSGLQ